MFPFAFPRVEDWEFSETVERLGEDVEDHKLGGEVYGMGYDGTCAEFIAVRPAVFARSPETLGLTEAGGVPLAGLTAWQGLFDHGERGGPRRGQADR